VLLTQNNQVSAVELLSYPHGGKPLKMVTISIDFPEAVAISPARGMPKSPAATPR
jgi:hypothetical protein